MSMEMMSWALEQHSLEPVDKFVLLAMCDSAMDSFSSASDAYIARYTNLPSCEVSHVVDRLVRLGLTQKLAPGRYVLAKPVEACAPSRPRRCRKKPIGPKLRLMVFERDGYACLRCHTRQELRADHVLPESAGGETSLESLQTLCQSRNCWKGTQTIDFRQHSGAPA